MSRLLLSILLLCFSLSLQAQPSENSEKTYYYFGNQKMLLKNSSTKFYVRLPENQLEAGRRVISNKLKIPSGNVLTLANDRVMVIDLGKQDETLSQNLRASLREANAEIVRPVLINNEGTEMTIDEGFYLKLKPGTTYKQLENFAEKMNCSFTKYKYDDRTFLLKAGRQNSFDGLQMANVFYESGLFEYAEPDFQILKNFREKMVPIDLSALSGKRVPASNFRTKQTIPNDPLYNRQWGLKNVGGANQWNGTPGADIEVEDAWDITMGDPSIKIAVIDNGVNRDHPDLINNIDLLGFGLLPQNATNGKFIDTANVQGSAIAGIIAAEANNNIGIAGVAPNCKIIPVNVTINKDGVYGTLAQISQGIDWAWQTAKADVLNNSWGGFGSSLTKDAIDRALTNGRNGKGAVVIFATMNLESGVEYPGSLPEVISVGAMSMCFERKSQTSCDGETGWGSNYGTGLDIMAPGVNIISTGMIAGSGNLYGLLTGTTASTALVSGVAALVLSENSNLTQTQVRIILEKSARKVGAYTYSRTEFQPYGAWNSEMGYGLVSAKNAVLMAQNNTPLCNVIVDRPASLQACNSTGIALKVTNDATGNTYKWRKDGTDINNATGTNYLATQSGAYDVVLKTQNGCEDTSYKFNVVISAPDGTLQADAGSDAAVAVNSKIFLGGAPSGKGGTAIIHTMRGIATDLYSNELWRFDPAQPTLKTLRIKSNFLDPNPNGDFYSGAASTPFGLFMVSYFRNIVKVDTANGNTILLGSITNDNGITFNGMAYDPVTGKILATGYGSGKNKIYEINPVTGSGTLLFDVTGEAQSEYFLSIAADNTGKLFAFGASNPNTVLAKIITIDMQTGQSSYVGNTGFKTLYNQDDAVDPLTNELYHISGRIAPLGGFAFGGKGLWKVDKSTGGTTLVGSVGEEWYAFDALAFANKEYKYQWSPAANLSNPNDANPQFTSSVEGVYPYTLTITDLCGNTATGQVTITVSAAMPVTLVNFSGRIQNNVSYLKWTVEQELNFDKYEIERSIDGTRFSAIGSIKSNGSGTRSEYSFNDDNLPQGAGIIYYRLKMVDLDGSFKNSDVIKLRNDQTLQNRLISISPNPFANNFTLKYESNKSTTMQVIVTDSKGQQVLRKIVELQTGVNQFNIDGTTLSKGIYFVRLQTDQDVTTQKIIKQ